MPAPACVTPGLVPPIPCRDDLAMVAQQYFSVLGRAVEVGVYQGKFSRHNLEHWLGEYAAVDTWNYRNDTSDNDKNFKDQKTNDANYELTRRNIAHAGRRARQVRLASLEAAATFPDGHFDWMYIDALHTYHALLRDLRAWWPKLRPGGLLSGDDYGDAEPTPMVGLERYGRPKVGGWARSVTGFRGYGSIPVDFHWGVIRATQEWANAMNASLHITWMPDCYPFPAWYMIKPGCKG